MKIAYRRMSGAIGLTELEEGTRGSWLEKRIGFCNELKRRGHSIDFIGRMTNFSERLGTKNYNLDSYDLLIIEFGSNNRKFYSKDLDETIRIANSFNKKIIFICDDPDLEYLWETIPKEKLSNWVCLINAKKPSPLLNQPISIKTLDMPFHCFLENIEPSESFREDVVYVGRPGGRAKIFNILLKYNLPIKIYGKQKEWKDFKVKVFNPPEQRDRKRFYNSSLACLVIADNKHKSFQWRTGRAYHALYAGCPVISEGSNDTFRGFLRMSTLKDIVNYCKELKNKEFRYRVWKDEFDVVLKDKIIAEETLNALGL